MIINKCKRQIALMLVFVIMLTLVFPIGTFAEDDSNDSEEKYIRAIPKLFNPSAGEEITIEWIFQIDHDTIIKIYRNNIDDNDENLVYESNCYSHGDYTPNYWTWDGRGNDGEIVPPGRYIIIFIPNDEFRDFPLKTAFGVGTTAAVDMEIDPNMGGNNEFRVHGSIEENTSKIELFFDNTSKGLIEI